MNRPFRPRPLDIHKKLPIVKSIKDLDSDEGARSFLHGNAINLDVEPVQTPAPKRTAGEIPTPQYIVVESYERDYLRTFSQPSSYVRGRGSRSEATEFVEYDIDNEDEDWLQQFNNERKLLSPDSLEWMLYKLELLDHKARERAGLSTPFGLPMPVLLQKEAALEALQSQTSRDFKPGVVSAVYDYWKAKRDCWRKPILRRLQPPPPVNDTNPFNVFRPREKIHRPHTRRMQRRENDVQSFEKLRQVHRSLEQAKTLLEMLQKREEKKREVLDCEVNLQRMRITLKHDCQLEDELIMTGTSMPFRGDDGYGTMSRSAATPDLVNGHVRLQSLGELTTPCSDGAVMLDNGQKPKLKWKKRRVHLSRGRPLKRVAAVDSLDPVMLFTKPVDREKLAVAGITPPLDPPANGLSQTSAPYSFQGRIGRGGRLIFDRWNALTRTPIGLNNFSGCSRASLTRFNPPPPRLNFDKVNCVVSDPAAVDCSLNPMTNENVTT